MISRRNLRVKIMQTIYSIESNLFNGELLSDNLSESPHRILNQKINSTSISFAAAMLYIARIAQYAEKDAAVKSSKLLPRAEDLNVNVKIAGNKALWKLLENPSFKEKLDKDKLDAYIDAEWVKKLYNKLINSEKYKAYIADANRNEEDERKILNYIWKSVASKDSNFQDILCDEWSGYSEDRALIRATIDFYFKDNIDFNFQQFLSIEKIKFADELLSVVIEKEEYLMELISPTLKNWDPERVALIDKILLKMGVAEFLYFDSIPSRVTINEYIEIAKEFSTEDSGKFLNAILDNVLRKLKDQGVVTK